MEDTLYVCVIGNIDGDGSKLPYISHFLAAAQANQVRKFKRNLKFQSDQ